MKILYAIQGTGNGHVSRAMEIVPHLKARGEVTVLVSGIASDLMLPFPVRYRLRGWSYIFGKNGGIDFPATLRRTRLWRLISEIWQLPVREFDLVISDFEPVSAWACILRRKRCIGLSNQAAIQAGLLIPPPKRDPVGSWILKYYAPCAVYYGFHFTELGPRFYKPVIRRKIRTLKVTDRGHYTVYLPAHDDDRIMEVLRHFNDLRWEVFSKRSSHPYTSGSVSVRPITEGDFLTSLAGCSGVLCAAGFATASEALFLRKKLLVVPMKNQIEQHYNAAVLGRMGVRVLASFSPDAVPEVERWIRDDTAVIVNYPDQTGRMLDDLIGEECKVGDRVMAGFAGDRFQMLPS